LKQRSPDLLSPLATAFYLSGFSSLIYQVVWQRTLTLYLGLAALSIILIVAVFMMGLGVGALAGGWIAARTRRPLMTFALAEGLLGLSGAAGLPLLEKAGGLIASMQPAGKWTLLFAVLVIPTTLMGLSLPLLASAASRIDGNFTRCLSRLYGINTLGAATGALLSGYVLVPFLGLNGSCYAAAVANLVVLGIVVGRLAGRGNPEAAMEQPAPPLETDAPMGRKAYVLVFVMGFVSIGYQILGYRITAILVKDSPYAYSTTLAACLLGIAAGSYWLEKACFRIGSISRAHLFRILLFCLGLSILAIFTASYQLGTREPFRAAIRASFESDLHPPALLTTAFPVSAEAGTIFRQLDVFVWPALFLFLPSALAGAAFPLIASLARSHPGEEGRAVGTAYFWGVAGNVLGSLLTGLVLLPRIGTERTAFMLGMLAISTAFLNHIGTRLNPLREVIAVAAALAIAAALFPEPGKLLAALHEPSFEPEVIELEEGLDAVVFTCQSGARFRNYINGQGHGYRPGPFFIAEAAEALSHLNSPGRILVIGLGAGNITEAVLANPELKKLTVVELSPSLESNLRKFSLFQKLLSNPKLELVNADGREYLDKSRESFNAILMDPVRTTTANSNNLHSRQFFRLAGKRLSSEGILMVGGLAHGPVIAHTLQQEFSHVKLYGGFCLASAKPLIRDASRFEALVENFPLGTKEFWTGILGSSVEGQQLDALVAGYPINEDWRPGSEYYLAVDLRRKFADRGIGR
jgi:spermidine synthase